MFFWLLRKINTALPVRQGCIWDVYNSAAAEQIRGGFFIDSGAPQSASHAPRLRGGRGQQVMPPARAYLFLKWGW